MLILSSKQVLSEDKVGVTPLLSSKSHLPEDIPGVKPPSSSKNRLPEDKPHNEVQPGMTMNIKVRNDVNQQLPSQTRKKLPPEILVMSDWE